ncbi:MAG: DUF3592 domain-containing protein [Alphaproteobacteria bacterium]
MSDSEAVERTPQQTRNLIKIFHVTTLAGVALIAWGIQMAVSRLVIVFNGETAAGVVVELEQETSGRSTAEPAYFPVVTFESRDGQAVTFRHRTGTNPPAYEKGETVEVVYFPDDPGKALIREGWLHWLGPVLLLALGSLVIAGSRNIIGNLQRELQQRRQSQPG